MSAINYDKHPLTIDAMLDRVAEAVKDFPKAALFELAERGFDSAFEILTACIISIRTRDEVTVPTAERLFSKARTPRDVARLGVDEIDHCIADCTFHQNKARQIQAIAADVAKTHGGRLPCDFETLTGYAGVGPKCANLTLGIACGMPTGVGVDIHVH